MRPKKATKSNGKKLKKVQLEEEFISSDKSDTELVKEMLTPTKNE